MALNRWVMAGAGGHGLGSLFKCGIAVAQGDDDPGLVAPGNEICVLQGLRRQGQDPDQAGERFHQFPAGFSDVAGLLGSFVFFADEGPFQVGPQDFRSDHCALGSPDGGEGLGDGSSATGHGGGQPAGDSGGRQQPAHGPESLLGAVHHILSPAAVDVEIEEPRGYIVPLDIDPFCFRRDPVRAAEAQDLFLEQQCLSLPDFLW